MIIICYKTAGENNNVKMHVRTANSSQKEINTSKLYVAKGAFDSQDFRDHPNDQNISLSISWKYWPDDVDASTPIKNTAPIWATFDGDIGSYWVYSLSCAAYIPYLYIEKGDTRKQEDYAGQIQEVKIITDVGKTVIFSRNPWDNGESPIWAGSHFEDGINQLIDEHKHIIVNNDRSISQNNVVFIKGDWRSQQVTFEIDEQYDGISILHKDVNVYVNFLPVGYIKPPEQKNPFLSDKIENKVRKDPDSPTILLKWNVPGILTREAGIVPYNIAIQSANYYWQTKDSSFSVLQSQFSPVSNVGDMEDTPLENLEDPFTLVTTQLANIDTKVEQIRSGQDETFVQNLGEYLAADSQKKTDNEESVEIIFDATGIE